jgi:hypothetical protein
MPSDFISTRRRQRACAHRSSSRTPPDAIEPRLFPRRSPQRSSANAARGGLEPLPAERLWRTNKPPSPIQHRFQWTATIHLHVRVHNKTLKYRPDFPGRFTSIESARQHCQVFFGWYNDEHRHTGLGLYTPADVHYGLAEAIRDKRAGVLDAAYAAHPERFVRKPPEPPKVPEISWINQPEEETQ